jgi:hypothetical protein
MASEDSDQILPRLPLIHRLRDLRDFDQAGRCQMPTGLADLKTTNELLEVVPLRCLKRVGLEERGDHVEKINPSTHGVSIQVLLVVVVPSVDVDGAHSEETPELLESSDASCTLHDHETVGHLEASLVPLPTHPIGLPNEADREASFSIYKTDDPASPDQPFLLVFRTNRIVTAHTHRVRRVPVGYSGFPAYSRIQTVTLL